MSRRRLVLVALCLGAALCVAAAAQALVPVSTLSADTGQAVKPHTPVISPRRLPELLAAQAVDAQTRAALIGDGNATGLGPGIGHSCLAVRQDGRPVVSVNVAMAVIPASTLKLLTATAALTVLGADTHFITEVRAPTPKNGTIDGPIYLIGGGDPVLFTTDYAAALKDRRDIHTSLETLADAVVHAGIRNIRGGVVGDDHRFDTQRSVPGWDPVYLQQGQVGPIGALLVNQGFGRFDAGRVATADPTTHAATVFTELLRARGVEVAGAPNSGIEGIERLGTTNSIATVASPSVNDIVSEMLTESDNTTAEMLVKDLGVKAKGQGTTAAGTQVVRETLTHLGISLDGAVLDDGSGLDRSDRVTCTQLMNVLELAGSNGLLTNDLARAAETGTLLRRFVGSPAVGHLRAKTGTLDGVSALAGWAQPPNADPAAFVLVNNEVSAQASRRLEDQVAIVLATLHPPPSADAYAPD